MGNHHVLNLFLICMAIFIGCGEDSEKPVLVIEEGDINGKVTDSEFGTPIERATVTIGDQTTMTDKDGSYSVQGINYSNELIVVVIADNYKEYKGNTSLQQELSILNISLVPISSEKAQVLEVLEGLSRDIESLDPDKIPSIQSRISRDYVTGEDEATALGVFAGVVPPSYNETPETVETIIERYDKIIFTFAEPNVTFEDDTALVEMRFEVYAETRPKPPDQAKKWEVAIDGYLKLRKENDNWKIIFWQLIPPFLKFKEEPM